MSDVLLAGLTLLSLAALATTFMIFPALWHWYRREMSRATREDRRRGYRAGALVLLFAAALGGVLIAEPWGNHTLPWVVIGIASLLLFWGGVTALTQGRAASRRARARRSDPG